MLIGSELWMKSMHQALVLGLTVALQECARNQSGTEEEAIERCRLAITSAIGDVNQIEAKSGEIRDLCLSIQNTMDSILDAAESEVRRNVGLPARAVQTHPGSRGHIH